MTMQITGWILMQMQKGPGEAGRGALTNHSYLEFAMYRLFISEGNLLGWGADARKAPVYGRGQRGADPPWITAVPCSTGGWGSFHGAQGRSQVWGGLTTFPSTGSSLCWWLACLKLPARE